MTADAFQTDACFWLSLFLLVGIGANALFGWWWADPLAALGMTFFIARRRSKPGGARMTTDCGPRGHPGGPPFRPPRSGPPQRLRRADPGRPQGRVETGERTDDSADAIPTAGAGERDHHDPALEGRVARR